MATISDSLGVGPAQLVAILDALGVFDDEEVGEDEATT